MECFDQQLVSKPANCCVNDGIEYSSLQSGPRKEDARTSPATWQKRLESILPC